jgi:hypothetical protein
MKKRQSLVHKRLGVPALLSALSLFLAGWAASPAFGADDSVCARVKIEIQQELTLERQAFDAHMRISNGLSHIALENVSVLVKFTDEAGNSVLASSDPGNLQALFFIRLDSMTNIDDVAGTGTVQPASTADIHWLIIPAVGAANGMPQGKLYNVGASLSYTIGGEEHVTDVSPDYIYVKPMPELLPPRSNLLCPFLLASGCRTRAWASQRTSRSTRPSPRSWTTSRACSSGL